MHTPQAIKLESWIADLLEQPLTARLATANRNTLQPHVVPVWFEWDGEAVWISSFDSTRKMRDLEGNPRVSFVVDVEGDNRNPRGVLFEGSVQVIADPAVVAPRSTSIYERYLGVDGAGESGPASWAVDPENRLIRLIPAKVFAWGG